MHNTRVHRRLVTFVTLMMVIVFAAGTASAQTKGRVSVGLSVTHNATTDDDVASATGVGVLLRLNPHKGWGPAGAFNWFKANLDDPSGAPGDFARLQVHPWMGGVSYTTGPAEALVSFSIVTGPSFNRARMRGGRGADTNESIHADTSWALRPGVGVTWSVAPRVGIVGFAGYLVNRPGVDYRRADGTVISGRWKADAFVSSVGVVYSIF
jgi:hypothetical protein